MNNKINHDISFSIYINILDLHKLSKKNIWLLFLKLPRQSKWLLATNVIIVLTKMNFLFPRCILWVDRYTGRS